MSYAWYPLWTAAAAVWVLIDARGREATTRWAIAVALGGPAALGPYLAFRPLRAAESRSGGRAWQTLSKFSVCWTGLLGFAAIWNIAIPFAEFSILGLTWGVPVLAAMTVGLALKRDSLIERGPLDLRQATELWFRRPQTTPDGRAYVCGECGNEYAVEQPFCDACGAWPGQSG